MNKDLQLVVEWDLHPGDRVVVPKSAWQLVQHHALYLGCDDFGNHYMSENVIGVGVKLTRVADFFQGVSRVTRIEPYTGSNYERRLVVERALTKLGQPYSLINYNCESFVNDALYQQPKSMQVGNVAGALGLALLIALLVNID
jgi:hypothetical protein